MGGGILKQPVFCLHWRGVAATGGAKGWGAADSVCILRYAWRFIILEKSERCDWRFSDFVSVRLGFERSFKELLHPALLDFGGIKIEKSAAGGRLKVLLGHRVSRTIIRGAVHCASFELSFPDQLLAVCEGHIVWVWFNRLKF